MSLIDTDNQYHVALNGTGLLLQGAPQAPAYTVSQAPLYNSRFGQGDRSYSDFSFWWFWAQTSFIGYKHDKEWADDGMLLDMEGVDLISDPGQVTLSYKQLATGSVAKNITMYDNVDTAGTPMLVGRNNTDQKILVIGYDGSTIWQDTAVGASEEALCGINDGDSYAYIGCHTVGSGASMLKKSNGGAFADVGAFNLGGGIFAMAPYPDGNSIYLFTYTAGIYVYDKAAGTFTQKKTSYPYGSNASLFVFSTSNHGKNIWLIGDRIYFMYKESNAQRTELWAYDIGDNAYVLIYSFISGQAPTRIVEFQQSIYLFDSGFLHVNVYKYNPTDGSMSHLEEIGRTSTQVSLVANPVRDATGIYFVLNDGSSDYQIWKIDSNDHFSSAITPPAAYITSISLLASSSSGNLAVVKDGASGTNAIAYHDSIPQNDYQTTGYITTSIFDGSIPALDKLFNDVTINFAALASGQGIEVLYSTNSGSSFTSLGSATFSNDGAITSKTFQMGSSIVTKKLVLKFILTGSGSTTPALIDFSVKYIPTINYTKLWQLRINVGDEVKRLNGALVTMTARELKGILENSWWSKSILDFQDIDYATTVLNGAITTASSTITVLDTSNFPEQGRLFIENEQIFYTGKTPTTFTGCTRGKRDTLAAAHADTTVVNNAYKVIVTDFGYVTPIIAEGKNLEYIINLTLREI